MIKQQNVRLGFILAMITTIMWGTVPIAMKYALREVDTYTLVWYRFVLSMIGITVLLAWRKKFPKLALFKSPRAVILLLIAALGLVGNFALFAQAVDYLEPTTTQIVMQLAVVLFMISSAIIFREQLRITQIIGIVVLIIGLLLFFNTNLIELFTNLSSYALGVWFGVAAAISWAIYALAQKAVLARFAAEQLLWLIYILCSLMLLPSAHPAVITQISWISALVVIYCGINTIVGYGCLVAAMEYWQASQVSAITTLTPLFTLIFCDLMALLFPNEFAPLSLNLLGYIGAVIVVAGAMFATIGHYIWHPRKGLLTESKK